MLCEKETFILKDEKCFDSGTTAHFNDCNCKPLLKIDDSYISQVHEENRCENVQRLLSFSIRLLYLLILGIFIFYFAKQRVFYIKHLDIVA